MTGEDVLLVCSGGGHLRQLAGFAERMGVPTERQVWVTFRNALSESLLKGRRVVYAPFTAPRDLRNFIKLIGVAGRVLKSPEYTFGLVVSTGSSPAVAFLPRAAHRGIPAHYIESAARADGPSMTGRILAHARKVNTYCQYPAWADERWDYRGSIFDAYEDGPVEELRSGPRTAVVSVGTQEGYPFIDMISAIVPLLQGVDRVLYQTGDADVTGLGIEGRASVPHSQMQEAMRDADIVISHAGVGAALTALEAGKHPILIPRRAANREHIDDHQIQVARELERRGLATIAYPDTLEAAHIAFASSRSVATVTPPPYILKSHPASKDTSPVD